MGWANVFPKLPDEHPMPGEKWILGECGCVGEVSDGIMSHGEGVFTYYIKNPDDTEGCGGDPNRSHWGVVPGQPGVKKVENLTTDQPVNQSAI